ncbi:MAG: YeeE/YedE thiosulfate transporter family protein [bacterium]|nr:YeeE/YedE thiosulfate transporter family protein [bacterium]
MNEIVAPLAKTGYLGPEINLVFAMLIGVGFGFFLERGGFGSSRKLTAQWFGKDWSVFRVMFSAIVVALFGIVFLDLLGLMPFERLYLNHTYLVPQILGGLMMGAGFVIGGYCPGTSFVGFASGKLDALVYIIGLLLGSVFFGEAYDLFAPIMEMGDMGNITLPEFFGLPALVVGLMVLALAAGGFWAAAKVENLVKDK